MKSFTDIGQFREVIRSVKTHHDYHGKDENGEPIYGHLTPYPTLRFRGTVKLHGCLDENTLITLHDDRVIKIKDVKPGMMVKCFDIETNEQTTNKVLNTINFVSKKQWCKLTFDDRIIICTADHKFWTKNRGYVQASLLLPTDEFEMIK